MERNAHRLTLHSPAERSLPESPHVNIDVDQLYLAFFPSRPPRFALQPVTTP